MVFSSTKGYRHKSIDAGKIALLKMGSEKKWPWIQPKTHRWFTEANLKQYGVVVFLSTTGNILNDEQQIAFQKYIQGGGGCFVGIHAATDTLIHSNYTPNYFSTKSLPPLPLTPKP
jgi:hypothetical protein